MDDSNILEMIKLNLALTTSTWDEYLTNLMEAAKQSIAREGITLGDTMEDANIIVMYTAYLYRKRTGDAAGMPRMLRYALNCRLFSEKAQ